MLEVKIYDDYNLYKKHTFEFNEGITCLIGKNGSGKSTLLKMIQEILKPKNCFYYDNEDSEKHAMDKFSFYGDMENLFRNFGSSEGQNIRNNFSDVVGGIRQYILRIKNKNKKQVVILLDGLDSGISLDYVVELKKDLFPLILQDCKENNLECYILISANNYEFCSGEECVRVSDAKHFKFKDYNDFRKIYLR